MEQNHQLTDLDLQYCVNADNLNSRIVGTLILLEDFADILQAETKALLESNEPEITRLQEPKVTLGRYYYEAMMALKEYQEEAKTLPQETKDKLRIAYKKMQRIFDENLRALRATKEAIDRMQRIIVEAARKAMPESPNYNARGYSKLPSDKAVNFRLNEDV